jgi:DNA-binding XRE family transcriptional regulator
METNDKIEVHIKEMRERRGFTMYRIAKILGKSSMSHLSQVELGKITPSVTLALEIANILNCKVEDIYKLTKKYDKERN